MRRTVGHFLIWVLLLFGHPFAAPAGQQPDEATIQRYSREAEAAMSRRDADAALAALNKLTQLTPDDPQVYANMGAVYYAAGRFAEAAHAFQKALRLDPKIPQAGLMVGLCDVETGDNKEAIPILESGFKHPPSIGMERTIGIKLVSAYLALGQPHRALEITGTLLDRYPNDPEILYRASHLYGDMALQTMMRLVNVAPDSVWKQMSFAEALESEKRYDLAIIEYRKVVGSFPNLAGVHYRLGRAVLLKSPDSLGARAEALKEFQEAVTLDPRNSAAEYEIGEIYRRQGQFALAKDHFSRSVSENPKVEDAQIALARTLLRLQEPKESVPHLLAAIQLNPTNEVSHFLLASAYRFLGDSQGYQDEMALYKRYHSEPYSAESGANEQVPQALSTPTVTKQTMDPGGSPQP